MNNFSPSKKPAVFTFLASCLMVCLKVVNVRPLLNQYPELLVDLKHNVTACIAAFVTTA